MLAQSNNAYANVLGRNVSTGNSLLDYSFGGNNDVGPESTAAGAASESNIAH